MLSSEFFTKLFVSESFPQGVLCVCRIFSVFFGIFFQNIIVEGIGSLKLLPFIFYGSFIYKRNLFSPTGGVRGGYFKLHLCSFRTADPVALSLLQRLSPVYSVESVEQALCIGAYAQTPLHHLLLHHGITAAHAHAVYHLVVGKYGAQSGTPVNHRLAQIGYAVVHQHLLLLLLAHGVPFGCREVHLLALCHVESLGALLAEVLYELLYRLCLLASVAVERVEHLLESPLCPFVIFRLAGAHLAVPVERESYLVQLAAVSAYVFGRSYGRMLSCLYGILLGGQSVGVVSHGVEHVISHQPLVAGVDVAGYVSQRMSHVQSCSRWIRKHVEHIEFLSALVFSNLVGLHLGPLFLPFLLNLSEIVFHCSVSLFFILCVIYAALLQPRPVQPC